MGQSAPWQHTADSERASLANSCRCPVRWRKRKGRMEGHKRDRARIVNASARENGVVGRHSLPGRVPNGRPGAGGALLSLRFMEFRPWLCANSEWSCYTFVAGVIVVLINALWYVLNSGEKKSLYYNWKYLLAQHCKKKKKKYLYFSKKGTRLVSFPLHPVI